MLIVEEVHCDQNPFVQPKSVSKELDLNSIISYIELGLQSIVSCPMKFTNPLDLNRRSGYVYSVVALAMKSSLVDFAKKHE